MTRKDFELIAGVIAHKRAEQARDYLDRDALKLAHFELDLLTRDMADALATTNPRFDRERFIEAAGIAKGPYTT